MRRDIQSFENRLLELLDKSDFERLANHLEPVVFDYKKRLYEANRPIEWVYFPTSGVVSVVITMKNGSAAEVGTIGNEGMVGLPLLFGEEMTPASAYVQVPGNGLRLRASVLADELRRSSALREMMLRYVHAVLNQVALTAACNALHSTEQRCCRWFLMTHDRVQSDTFLLTQEFLGMMLGVQRTGVTVAATKLRKRGAIDYQRGEVTILKRHEVEEAPANATRWRSANLTACWGLRSAGPPPGARKRRDAPVGARRDQSSAAGGATSRRWPARKDRPLAVLAPWASETANLRAANRYNLAFFDAPMER